MRKLFPMTWLAVLLTPIAGVTGPSPEPWIFEQTELYRVVEAEGVYARPYFQLHKVVSSADSALGPGFVHTVFVWCESADSCVHRDFNFGWLPYPGQDAPSRVLSHSGQRCEIMGYSRSGDQIRIWSDLYEAREFSTEECAAGVSASLPAKFTRVSRTVFVGERLSPAAGQPRLEPSPERTTGPSKRPN
jgi:hypothetical protein